MNKKEEIFTIGEKVLYNNEKYTINKFEIINNIMFVGLIGINIVVNLKDIVKYVEPKFTFGGYECSFKLRTDWDTDNKKEFKTLEITCKDTTGTHWELEKILKNYFRPCKFGNVEVKSYSFNEVIKTKQTLNTVKEGNDINVIKDITIGCLTGKYSELVDIYNHCLNLLK